MESVALPLVHSVTLWQLLHLSLLSHHTSGLCPPWDCIHSPQHLRDPDFGLPVTFPSHASNLFLRCLLFPSASEAAAHIAEFTRADGIPREGSRAAF